MSISKVVSSLSSMIELTCNGDTMDVEVPIIISGGGEEEEEGKKVIDKFNTYFNKSH